MAGYGAIELGGTKVRCALFEGDVALAETRFATGDFEATLVAIARFFAPFRGSLSAVGVASFGPLELDRTSARWGSLLATPKPGWSGAPLAARLGLLFGVPVAIDTDVNAAALAEQRLGAGLGADPCVYVTVGTGIGVGAVVNGAPLHGLMHPELGHVPAPGLCDFVGACPFHGRCLEGVASGSALAARTGGRTAELADDDPLWRLTARYLAHLVEVVVLALSPRRIMLGGGVMQRPGLLAAVQREASARLHGYVPRPELDAADIVRYLVAPGLGDRAGLIGAHLLAKESRP